jgi:hypothetical protein
MTIPDKIYVDNDIEYTRSDLVPRWLCVKEYPPPKNMTIMLYGFIDPESKFELLRWDKPSAFSGRWCSLDEAWVPSGGTWEGPFMIVSHWAEMLPPPEK